MCLPCLLCRWRLRLRLVQKFISFYVLFENAIIFISAFEPVRENPKSQAMDFVGKDRAMQRRLLQKSFSAAFFPFCFCARLSSSLCSFFAAASSSSLDFVGSTKSASAFIGQKCTAALRKFGADAPGPSSSSSST